MGEQECGEVMGGDEIVEWSEGCEAQGPESVPGSTWKTVTGA